MSTTIPNARLQPARPANVLLPVLPLRDLCLFPEASLSVSISAPLALHTLDIALRTGKHLLAIAYKDNAPGGRDLHPIGTVAEVAEQVASGDGERRIELDGLRRARVVTLVGVDTLLAEIELLEEGDGGDDWGSAVEALARYLHTHAELRAFLDQQRRSREPMSWVNLACQHLPITPSARSLSSGAVGSSATSP